MNKISVGLLTAAILLNTACSPKQEETPGGSIITSSVSPITATSSSSASQPAAEMTSAIDNELMDTEWRLISLNDQGIVTAEGAREAHIMFNEENRVVLHDGCNQLTGSFTLDGEKLAFSDMVSTRMACKGTTDQPKTFNEALTKVATYSLVSDELVFRDAGGVVLARFQKATPPDAQ